MSGILEDGRVYRIFGSLPEFGEFLRGSWRGAGMHGLPEFPSDSRPVVALRSGKKSMVINLKGKSGIQNFFRIPGSAYVQFPDIQLQCPLDSWNVGTDISSYADENYKIEVHAMKEEEIYFLLELLHPARRILFAGVLKKRNIFWNVFAKWFDLHELLR